MRLYKDTQYTHSFLHFSFLIMSRSIALSLLAQGNNGNELLQILDGLVESSDDNEPTLNEVQF